ncbi:MAG: hypothetical protein FD145_242 [Candidatus Saganbacteria bacterium]|uniref:Nucleotidyl transferase AbiEii/AbiGii toxin family protein n=1 Tax=Candidatus Saganbacteria bacterium TaxID=2575572 RepID=A0A833L296_UNCSA|nr:MAG: hypothetical protein FD145_242 [Candidatus Saganbacteria bacterium]
MISEKQIEEIAVKMQTSAINVAREYAQNLFLQYFYAQEGSEAIYFKGGTALRILYRSPRFSEDLDFSTSHIDKSIIEKLLQETAIKIDEEGVLIEIEEAKPTSGGYLGEIKVSIGAINFNIMMEISSRKKKTSGETVVVENPYVSTYTVLSLKKEELIAEKIEALLDRKKPRDFFDLYFMLRANLIPNKKFLKLVIPLLGKTKIDFKNELGEFLPRSFHPIIKKFPVALAQEIRRHL